MSRGARALEALAGALLPLVLALGVAGLVLALLGFSPGAGLAALLRGSMGSAGAWTSTLLKTGPLLLTGLAVTLAFRCGVWNIGAEGQLYGGALLATAVGTAAVGSWPGAWLGALLAGALGGAVVGGIAGVLRATRGVSEVISTILLNFIAIQAVAWAIQGPLQEAAGSYPQSDAVAPASALPALGRLHLGVALAVLAAPAVHLFLGRTAPGFRLRAVGLDPLAARFAGLPAARLGAASLAAAGALAGLAGAAEVAGVTSRLYEGLSPGTGYTAIAVALLARLQPLGVLPAALFFGALASGAGAMQRDAGIPAVAAQVVQGLVVLLTAGIAWAPRLRARPTATGPSAEVA